MTVPPWLMSVFLVLVVHSHHKPRAVIPLRASIARTKPSLSHSLSPTLIIATMATSGNFAFSFAPVASRLLTTLGRLKISDFGNSVCLYLIYHSSTI